MGTVQRRATSSRCQRRSVAGGTRINFLSATVPVDIAERLLRLDRPSLPDGDRARVLRLFRRRSSFSRRRRCL
jgi:hypothetical protein